MRLAGFVATLMFGGARYRISSLARNRIASHRMSQTDISYLDVLNDAMSDERSCVALRLVLRKREQRSQERI